MRIEDKIKLLWYIITVEGGEKKLNYCFKNTFPNDSYLHFRNHHEITAMAPRATAPNAHQSVTYKKNKIETPISLSQVFSYKKLKNKKIIKIKKIGGKNRKC